MNWTIVAACVSALSFLASVIGAAITHGRLTERVDGNGKRIAEVKEEVDKRIDKVEVRTDTLEVRANTHGEKIGRLEEWKQGVNVGVTVAVRDMQQ